MNYNKKYYYNSYLYWRYIMLIENAEIYHYIKEYLKEIPIITLIKGTCFSKAENIDNQIYYILEGTVKIESHSDMGKKILVDVISENEFAGQISYIRKHNFYGNNIAVTEVKLLCLKDDIMNMLMKNPEFSTFFYFKTSSRIYVMYKKMLMSNLFSQCELVAYHLLENSCDCKFIYKSIYDICANLNISRRSLYNILNKLEGDGIIKKLDEGPYLILDENYLKKKSKKVKSFAENKY